MRTHVAVSFIIPVYNVEHYLRQCLDSVVHQTLQEIEIICVDDGSTDGSAAILDEYATKDPRIHIIRQRNQYAGVARNHGMKNAIGEYLYFMDSDDYADLTLAEKAYACATGTNADVVLFGGEGFSNDSGTVVNMPHLLRTPLIPAKQPFCARDIPNDIFQIVTGAPWSKLFRRQLLQREKLLYQPLHNSNDAYFVYMAIVLAERIATLREKLIHYRRGLKTSLQNTRSKHPFSFARAHNAIKKSLYRRGLYLTYQRSFNKRIIDCIAHFKSKVPPESYSNKALMKIEAGLLSDRIQTEMFFTRITTCMQVKKAWENLWRGDHYFIIKVCRRVGNICMDGVSLVGRVVAFSARKVRGFFKCLAEHGILYTARRILVHLHIAKETQGKSENSERATNAHEIMKIKPNTKLNDDGTGVQVRKRDYYYWLNLPESEYAEALKALFKSKTNSDLNLENPRTYNEKIQWIKLYEANPLKTKCTDKYGGRDYVRSVIGDRYLIPLIGVWDNVDSIDFDSLPNRFVLKATHGCGWNIVVQDKAILDIHQTKEMLSRWLRRAYAYYTLELHYLTIPPRIIAEEYLEGPDGDLFDYKVWCFGGKAYFVHVVVERQHGLKKAFYNLKWNRLPITYNHPQYEKEVKRPAKLEELVAVAEALAKPFNHVRVDLYVLENGDIKVGEMTFTSASGFCNWSSEKLNRSLGRLLHIGAQSNESQVTTPPDEA